MYDRICKIGRIVLSVPFFIRWPFIIWNWAAHAHYIPAEERNPLFSWCLAGFGTILMLAMTWPLAGFDLWVFLKFFGPYVGAGIPAMIKGIELSRKYRPLREMYRIQFIPEQYPQA